MLKNGPERNTIFPFSKSGSSILNVLLKISQQRVLSHTRPIRIYAFKLAFFFGLFYQNLQKNPN